MTPFDVLREIAIRFGCRRVLDVGCGGGELLAQLAGAGFAVTGVEPGVAAVARARQRNPGIDIFQSGAEALPPGLSGFDMVAMVNALHHVPVPVMAQAIAEARRVLAPDGVFTVIEPAAHGSFFTAMLPIEDETVVRGAAQAALREAISSGDWRLVQELSYEREELFADVDAFIARVVAVDPARLAVARQKRPDIAAAFAQHAQPQGDGLFLLANPAIVKVLAPA